MRKLSDPGNRCDSFDLSVILAALEKRFRFELIDEFVNKIRMGFGMGDFVFLFLQDLTLWSIKERHSSSLKGSLERR